MKKLLAILAAVAILAVPATAVAAKAPLSPAYQAVYCYPTGTYWQKQIAAYPAYYAKHNAKFEAKYGANTRYCN